MKSFRFLVEVAFVYAEGGGDGRMFGFYATVTVRAGSLEAAKRLLSSRVVERITIHGLVRSDAGVFRTRCRIDKWRELFHEEADAESNKGLTLFEIGKFSSFWTVLRIRLARTDRIVDISA